MEARLNRTICPMRDFKASLNPQMPNLTDSNQSGVSIFPNHAASSDLRRCHYHRHCSHCCWYRWQRGLLPGQSIWEYCAPRSYPRRLYQSNRKSPLHHSFSTRVRHLLVRGTISTTQQLVAQGFQGIGFLGACY